MTLFFVGTTWLAGNITGQPKFSYDDIAEGLFQQNAVRGFRSAEDGLSYTVIAEGSVVRYAYETGEIIETVYDAGQWEGSRPSDYDFSRDESALLLVFDREAIYRHSFRANFKIYDRKTGILTPLSEGKQQAVSFSPDGKKVAFVRDNDLYYTEISTGAETRVTYDGEVNRIRNGIPDWVYEEEFSFSRAYEWSPGSDRIVFLRFDESEVLQYPMNIFEDRLYPSVYSFKYPKAGERNSDVQVCVFDLNTGETNRIDTGKETDRYIPRIQWSAANRLAIYHLNRLQNRFDLLEADVDSGTVRNIYSESDSRYIERVGDQTVTFLGEGDEFVVMNETSGYHHLYLWHVEKGPMHPITSGEWEVTSLAGIDLETNTIYYLSNEGSPLRRNLWAIKTDGSGKRRMTEKNGTYQVTFSKGFRYYTTWFSNAVTPTEVELFREDGTLVRTLENNDKLKETLQRLDLPQKRFIGIDNGHGDILNAYVIYPEGFDPKKSYPVLMTQYSGPGSQRVTDSWSMDWTEVLCQQGYIVACVDGRGTGGRGAEFRKCTYRQLGKLETEDQIAAARYLASLPYVDANRIGIYGWSYGGFMALNCILKGNDVFSAAIAVAPVTNWRYYDTVYTELYNGLPQDNPEGYDENSPVFYAGQLEGKLLIAHGTGDDNVHIQNTYEMIDRLVFEDKPFEMYIYPDKNHSMAPGGRNHLLKRCIEFLDRNL